MKPRLRPHLLRSLATLPCGAFLLASAATATLQYWNPGGTGGDAIWSTGPADKNWNPVAGAPSGNTTWNDAANHTAAFADALGGTVTVFDPVSAAGILQNGASYRIQAGTITLTGSAPAVDVRTGTLTLQSTIAGTAGLVKSGPGTLVLEGSHPFTGRTLISAGTLTLNGSLTSNSVETAAGATLIHDGDGLAHTTVLVNQGTATLNGTPTVARLANLGGTLNGTGTLTVTGATAFSGGSIAPGFTLAAQQSAGFDQTTIAGTANVTGTATLRDSQVTGILAGNVASTGNTTIAGAISGSQLQVNTGTLTMTGTAAHTTVAIASGATLADVSGGLANNASLTNAGTLDLSTVESLTSYVSNGGTLSGSGALRTSTSTLNDGSVVTGSIGGTVTTHGTVLISGTLNGGSLAVADGTLTLSGRSVARPVTIAAAGRLVVSGEGLTTNPAVTNAGILTYDGSNKIQSYIQNGNGRLDGSGVLNTFSGATLNGGSVAAILEGPVRSTSNVEVSGTLRAGKLDVEKGTLTLSGTIASSPVTIASGAAINVTSGRISATPPPTVTNAGTLTVNESGSRLQAYNQNNGTLAGTSTLSANLATLNGGSLSGKLSAGNVTVTQSTSVPGTITTPNLSLTGGTLDLTGSLQGTLGNATISNGATLFNKAGGLADTLTLTNSGTLNNAASDTLRSYHQTATGQLTGNGTLHATTTAAIHGGTIAGHLTANEIQFGADTTLTGSAAAPTIRLLAGTLANTGTLGSPTTTLDLAAGTTLTAAGTQSYANLTTTGSAPAHWQGHLVNPATVTPGGTLATGTLAINGDFTNTPTGTLRLDVAGASSDRLTVTGTANFGGTLTLNALGPLPAFTPLTVVAASTYSGNFSNLTENLPGAVWFNPANGTINPLAATTQSTLWGTSANQTATWIALFDDVISPGVTNVIPSGSGYEITSGIADASQPDLLHTLAASMTPAGLDTALLNRLSPESYLSFHDYGFQSLRALQRAASDAPSLGWIAPAHSPPHSTKDALPDSAKGGMPHPAHPAPATGLWEWFAAASALSVESSQSANQADTTLEDAAFLFGARTMVHNRLRVAAFLGANTGSIEGALLDADADGWTLGMFADLLVDDRTHTLLTAGWSYGRQSFEGTRASASATATGWSPASSPFSSIDSEVFEVFVGARSLAFHTDRFRLLPSVGLRHATSALDGFSESTRGPGGAIALTVDGDHQTSALAEISVHAEYDLHRRLTLHGLLGASAGINDDPATLRARFAAGNRAFDASGNCLSNDVLFLGLGASYRLHDNVSLGLHYRSDFRSGADPQQNLNLSSSFRF